eukprot:c32931_g1_i1 orf=61-348(-)
MHKLISNLLEMGDCAGGVSTQLPSTLSKCVSSNLGTFRRCVCALEGIMLAKKGKNMHIQLMSKTGKIELNYIVSVHVYSHKHNEALCYSSCFTGH